MFQNINRLDTSEPEKKRQHIRDSQRDQAGFSTQSELYKGHDNCLRWCTNQVSQGHRSFSIVNTSEQVSSVLYGILPARVLPIGQMMWPLISLPFFHSFIPHPVTLENIFPLVCRGVVRNQNLEVWKEGGGGRQVMSNSEKKEIRNSRLAKF